MTTLQPFDDERISAYLDGELSDIELAEFEKLLAQHRDYARAVEELRAIRLGIKQLPQHKLPENFAQRVLRQAEREMLTGTVSREPRPIAAATWSRTRWLAVATTALAACLLIMVVFQRQAHRQTEVALAEKPESKDVATAHVDVEKHAGAAVAETTTGLTDAENAVEPAGPAMRQPAAAAPATARYAELKATSAADAATNLPTMVRDAPANRQLIEQARSWQAQPDSVADEWDFVVATQLRAPADWRRLDAALVANRLQLTSPTATVTEQLAELDAGQESSGEDFDAAAMNERLLRKLRLFDATAEQPKPNDLAKLKRGPAATPDTHVLYVEGTAEQINGLVSQLPNSGQLVSVKSAREGDAAGTRLEEAASEETPELADKVASVLQQQAVSQPGRAAHLGKSTLSEAMSPTVRGRAQQVSSAWQQADRSQSLRRDEEAHDLPFLRGVIILQDLSGSSETEP